MATMTYLMNLDMGSVRPGSQAKPDVIQVHAGKKDEDSQPTMKDNLLLNGEYVTDTFNMIGAVLTLIVCTPDQVRQRCSCSRW